MSRLFASVAVVVGIFAASSCASADPVEDVSARLGRCTGNRVGCADHKPPNERTASDLLLLRCDREFPGNDDLFHNRVIRGGDPIRRALMDAK